MDDVRLELALRALAPRERRALGDAGYIAAADFAHTTAAQIAGDSGVCREKLEAALNALDGEALPLHPGSEAWPHATDTAAHESSCILTFSRALDDALGGGVARGRVTEIIGRPGAGKTQLAMQLAVNTCIPCEVGGCDGEVLYLDVEGSLLPRRCRQIAAALVDHLRAGLAQSAANSVDPEYRVKVRNLSVEAVLNRIGVMRVLDKTQVLAAVRSLPTLLDANPRCRLFVIDSIAFAFRQDTDNFAQRAHLLSSVALALREAAARYSIAVVVLNQVTTRADGTHTPALGAAWAFCAETRLWMSVVEPVEEGRRAVRVVKHAHHPAADVEVRVCTSGIRDAPPRAPPGDGLEA